MDSVAHYQRLDVDLADLNLSGVTELVEQPHAAVAFTGKHLCGGAFDLCLQCIVHTMPQGRPLAPIAISLCCHHRCEWKVYCGKRFMRQHGIGPREFKVLCRMTRFVRSFVCLFARSRLVAERSLTPPL